jgi:hypothetical protein
LAVLVAFAACSGDETPADDGGTTTTGIDFTTGVETGGTKLDMGGGTADESGGPPVGCANSEFGCSNRLDLLFVIDNSGSMGEEQLNLARNLPGLVSALEVLEDSEGNLVNADVNIMVTTTDSGNILCEPFYKPGRSAENGEPITSPCTDRLARFESVAVPPVNEEGACTEVCPNPIGPPGNFINFSGSGTNVPDAPPADVNGDGIDDSNVAQALACIGPQGIDGCGYESPLESMMQALEPGAAWNVGDEPFLRDGGLLAVAVITDEADCSVIDESIMSDTSVMEMNPETMSTIASSAICWNAGVSCTGPDGNGVYSDCASTGTALRPVDEYISFLQGQGRPVVMLGIVGIPPVTARNPDPPFEPTAGGVLDLVYRDWRDPDFPNGGDVLPDDWAAGRDAAYKEWQFGIGPGCTGEDGNGGFTGQAIPPVRIKEVCESLNAGDEIRCCMESVCDTDFSGALQCLAGLVSENVPPVG